MTPRRATLLLLLLAVILGSAASSADAPAPPREGVIDKNTTWEGRMTVDRPLSVAKGAVLTLQPGTVVVFRKGALLAVEGALVAEGTRDAPIRFESAEAKPMPGDWEGIRFSESGTGSVLSRCVVRHASSVDVSSPDTRILDGKFEKGKTGLVIRLKSAASIAGNTITNMTEGGILCQQGTAPRIEKNVVRACGPNGIACSQSAFPQIRENDISECERGLAFGGVIPPVERNVFRNNGVGLAATRSGSRQILRGNRFEGNRIGLLIEKFSDPIVEGNRFSGNGEALVCFRSSGPVIRNNEISGNDNGIVASQLSRPRIVANEIRGNKRGIYLTHSSYATVNGNNIHENGIQMELGLMSSDWEKKIQEKPLRGSAAQRSNQARRGVLSGDEIRRGKKERAAIAGSVDATGNWWGERDTAEMAKNGDLADITGLIDFFDAPTHPSEGYPGEYEQDRIRYDGWVKSRIPGAGLPPDAGFSGKIVRDGGAVPGARVYAYRTFADVGARTPFAVSTPSSEDGSFQLDLPPGTYYLVAKKRTAGPEDGPLRVGDDFGFQGGNPMTALPGNYSRVGFPVVRLEKETEYGEVAGMTSGELSGIVTLGGKPAEGVDVLLYTDGGNAFRGMPYAAAPPTPADGSFRFDSLPEADYWVLARKRSTGKGAGPLEDGDTFGFYAANPVHAKAGNLARIRFAVITKTGGGKRDNPVQEGDTAITGVILDKDRNPVQGVYAFVYSEKTMSHGRPDVISRPVDDSGRYVIRLPRGGKYFLGARSEYGDTPAPGEWYGRYEGTPDHSLRVETGQLVDRVEVIVERVLR